MKKLRGLYIAVVLLFVILGIMANASIVRMTKKKSDVSNTVMNRIYRDVQASVDAMKPEAAGEGSADISEDVIRDILQHVYDDKRSELAGEFSGNIPAKAYYIPREAGNSEVSLINKEGMNDKLWAVHRDGEIIGFLVFEFGSSGLSDIRFVMNISLIAAFLITMGVCIYVRRKVLKPFSKLATYPEKLSKNEISEKLPETKNHLFDRFIWGVNMLSDRLKNDRNRIRNMSKERQTMLTTIAHGIKTPVSNIKLYADAIESGLYQPDGKINGEDARIARKISKNADDIAILVKNLIEATSEGLVDFEPDVNGFYLNELIGFLNEEYSNRLDMLRIPHSFHINNNLIIKSDKSGICRILAQLMDNAIKYGNGQGITVAIDKDDDGYYISVRNKGELIADSELPYIFRSFWRGSNAGNAEGSGIGLFEAREIARKLGGDLYVKIDREAGEMEFLLWLQ